MIKNLSLIRSRKRILAVLSLTTIIGGAYAAEIDSFTNRTWFLENMVDSTVAVERIVDYYIDVGIEKTNNKDQRSCSTDFNSKRKDLIKNIRRYVSGHWRVQNGVRGFFEINGYRIIKYPEKYPKTLERMGVKLATTKEEAKKILAGKKYAPLMITYVRVPDSIYSEMSKIESPSVGFVSMFHDTLAATMKIGEGKDAYLMGSDKLTHFFNRGRKYYAYYYGEKDDAKEIDDPVQRELFTRHSNGFSELSFFGAKSTGVSSYGDLAANFQGLRFWNDFTARGPDVVTQEISEPFVKCIGNQWVRTSKKFKLSDYANKAWDEGNNCSYYKSDRIIDSVKDAINHLPIPQDRKHCSIDFVDTLKLFSVYGRFFDETVNVIPYLKTPHTGNGFLTMIFTGNTGAPGLEDYQDETLGKIYECKKIIKTTSDSFEIFNDGLSKFDAEKNTAELCSKIVKEMRIRKMFNNVPNAEIDQYCAKADSCYIAIKH